MTQRALLVLALALAANVSAQQVELLTDEGILFWSPEQQITGYRGIDKLFPTREIFAGETAYPLIPDKRDLSDFRYRYDGKRLTIDDYVRDMHVGGIIAVKDGRVLLERYGLGNDENSRWISFSVAKSVVSMLIGAAMKDGYINSVDDLVVDYLPRLKGGPYDKITLKNILQMASGVAWNEDYDDATSNVANSPGGTLPLLGYMRGLSTDVAPDTKFNYNTGETNIAGALLRAAIGNNLSTYLSTKIWQPFGMESDANWLIEASGGVEFGGCCINATLRDYARIGIFAMRDGVLPNGERVLPEGWMKASTTASNAYDGYGYYWWLFFGDGVYAALGVFGQLIYIDPNRNLVIAMHSAWPEAGSRELGEHRSAFLKALAKTL